MYGTPIAVQIQAAAAAQAQAAAAAQQDLEDCFLLLLGADEAATCAQRSERYTSDTGECPPSGA